MSEGGGGGGEEEEGEDRKATRVRRETTNPHKDRRGPSSQRGGLGAGLGAWLLPGVGLAVILSGYDVLEKFASGHSVRMKNGFIQPAFLFI